MKPRRTSAAEALGVPPVRVVIVTLDSHLASATERAQHLLLRELPGLRLSLHAAAEWADDPSALDRCNADIAQGDIIVVTMMFMEDHIQAVLPALVPAYERALLPHAFPAAAAPGDESVSGAGPGWKASAARLRKQTRPTRKP